MRISMYVGITTKSNTNHRFFNNEDANDIDKDFGYGYCLSNGYKTFKYASMMYGIKVKEGDTLCLILDLNQKQIRFMVNDKDLGIAFREVIHGKNIKYKFVVSLHDLNDSATLTKFECTAP